MLVYLYREKTIFFEYIWGNLFIYFYLFIYSQVKRQLNITYNLFFFISAIATVGMREYLNNC